MTGVIEGKLIFVVVSYTLTWLTLGGYAASLLIRGNKRPPEDS